MNDTFPSPGLVDVAVVGAGPVGASAALAAERLGLQVVWLGRELGSPSIAADKAGAAGDGFDSRVYALSQAAKNLLGELRVWDALAAARIAPIYDMRILPTTDGVSGNKTLHFGAYEGCKEALAWIVEGCNLSQGLRRAVDFSRIRTVAADLAGLELDHPQHATLQLDDGSSLRARLIVGADGAGSPTRGFASLPFKSRDYSQTAVVANFGCTVPHADCAWQWFGEHGVLALLPLPGPYCSMVWSAPHELASQLMALDSGALAARVLTITGGALGELRLVSRPASFALRRLEVSRISAPRVVLVGDAAHVIHPLAGQGMNLGFADVAALSAVLKARESFRDVGDRLLLRRYERSRKEAVAAMTLATDGLQRLFDPEQLARLGMLVKPVTLARDIGWSVVARSSWIKRQVMDLAAT